MVLALCDQGYSGAVITDHFFNGNCGVDQRQPWVDKVNDFCAGYEAAVEAAKGLDFDVLFTGS